MSELSYLEKLMYGVEVEWITLGSVCKIETGKLNANAAVDDGEFMFFTTAKEASRIDKYRWDTEALLIAGNANVGEIKHYNGKFDAYQRTYVLTNFENNVNVRYLYFVLNKSLKKYLEEKTNSAAMTYIVLSTLENFKIPIPCSYNPEKSLTIQSEIVQVLDKFTDLITKLTTERIMRVKQYNYYRDLVLNFEENEVEWKTLAEVALNFGRGKSKHRPRNDERLYGGDIPFIQTGDIRSASHIITEYSQTYSELGLRQSKLWPKGTLCITIAANIAETSILGFNACFPDSIIGFVPDPSKTSSGYVEYLLQSVKSKLEAKGKEKSSAQSNINLGTFEQLKLPFPSLTEQARIVNALDKFETMINSIKEGLPREIELRQKQYEHYRDLLLSFPEQVTASN